MALRPASKGEILQSAQFLQFLEEDVPGTFNQNAQRHILTCIKGETQPEEAWDSFRPDGVHEDAWAALSKEHVLYTGSIRWDYSQQFVLARMLFGISDNVRALTTGSGFIEEQFALTVHDARPLKTYTLEYGSPGFCNRHPYAMLVSINRNSDRDANNVDGQLVIMARKAIAEGVAMTGGTPRNTVLAINAAGVTTDGVFAVNVPTLAPQNVTLSSGDTVAQTKAKFEALDGVDTVAVVGTVATAPGELHNLVAHNANGTALIYDSVSVAPGTSAVTAQAAVRAKGGDYSAAVVTAILNLAAGANILTSSMILGSSGGTALGHGSYPDVVDGNNSTYIAWGNNSSGWVDFNLNAVIGLHSMKLRTGPTNGGTFQLYGSNVPFTAARPDGGGTKIGNDIAQAAGVAATITFATIQNYQYFRLACVGSAQDPDISEIELYPVVNNSSYAIQFPNGVGNVTDIAPVPGTNWTGTTTPAGSSGGNIAVTVSAPANTPITISPVSGAGWSSSLTQLGDDGKIRIGRRDPIMPQHWGLRVADARADLVGAALVPKVKRMNISFESLIEAVFFANEGETSYQSHSDSDERAVSISLLVAVSSPYFAQFKADAKTIPSRPRWYELRDVSGDANKTDRWQFLASISAAKQFSAAGKVRAIEITLKPVLDDLPFTENLVTDGGASTYFITRRPN